MTKKEFQEAIQRCRDEDYCRGLCHRISRNVGFYAKEIFYILLKPHQESSGYWLCSYACFFANKDDNMTTKERRLLFLDAFEGYCLAEKAYKDFEKHYKELVK